MIVYEVNLDVDASAFAEFCAWLDLHVREMLALRGFVAAEVLEVRYPAPAQGRRCLCARYRLDNTADLERYLREDAPRMRTAGLTRFPGQFSAARRILAPLA